MKTLSRTMVFFLLAVPAFAQDDVITFDNTISGSQLDALFGGGGQRGGFQNLVPDPELMTSQLKDLLKSKDVPLSKDQEKNVKELLTAERVALEQLITTQFGNRGNNNQNNNRNNNNFNPRDLFNNLEKTIQKHNTELLAEMKTDLTPEQSALVTRAEKDKKKVCTVMLDVLDFKKIEEGQNAGGPGGFGGGFGGFGGFDGGGFDGGFGGFGGGGGRGGGRGNRGIFNQIDLPNRPNCTTQGSTAAERLAAIAQILSKGKQPLTADQESKFSGLIETRMELVEEEIAANQQMASIVTNLNRNENNDVNPQQLRNNIVTTILQQLGIPTNNGGRGNRGGGGGGNAAGNRGRGNAGGFNIETELRQRREAMLDKIAAALNPNQQPHVKKVKYDEIKERGGAEEIRGILAEQDTPLAAEQLIRIQEIFDTSLQSVRRYAEEMVTEEISKLSPDQLKPPPPDPKAPQTGNPDPNNVNQNPRAQQIVARLLPQVSVRRAVIDRARLDAVMKVLTPAQVASYKLSSL